MQLSQADAKLFYKLYPALLFYGNQELKVVKDVPSVDVFMELPVEERVSARDALYERLDLIDAFVNSNPLRFSDEELDVILSWKNLVTGTFQLFRYLKKYAIFLDDSSRGTARKSTKTRVGFHSGVVIPARFWAR